jgi:hypothetical protein
MQQMKARWIQEMLSEWGVFPQASFPKGIPRGLKKLLKNSAFCVNCAKGEPQGLL